MGSIKRKPSRDTDDIIYNKISETLTQLNKKLENGSKFMYEDGIEVEDGQGTGKMIKFSPKVFNQMLYSDVQSLKRNTESFFDDYSKEMKPVVKRIDNTLTSINDRVSSLEKKQPKKFAEWISEKSDFANKSAGLIKFIAIVIILFYIIFSAPSVINIIEKIIKAYSTLN